MNQAMWADGITQSNLEALQHRRTVWGRRPANKPAVM